MIQLVDVVADAGLGQKGSLGGSEGSADYL